MKQISQIIESFSDWSKPWTFYKFILNNTELNNGGKEFFSKIYKEASNFELWNYSDLTIGSKNSRKFLRDNTEFSEKAINQIVNAIAYEWR